MKQHPFFAAVNWSKLAKKQVKPPIKLHMDEAEESKEIGKELTVEDEEEAQFLNFG